MLNRDFKSKVNTDNFSLEVAEKRFAEAIEEAEQSEKREAAYLRENRFKSSAKSPRERLLEEGLLNQKNNEMELLMKLALKAKENEENEKRNAYINAEEFKEKISVMWEKNPQKRKALTEIFDYQIQKISGSSDDSDGDSEIASNRIKESDILSGDDVLSGYYFHQFSEEEFEEYYDEIFEELESENELEDLGEAELEGIDFEGIKEKLRSADRESDKERLVNALISKPEKLIKEAEEEAEKILAEARAQAVKMLESAENEKEAILLDAKEQGYNEGFEKGQNQGYIDAMNQNNDRMMEEANEFAAKLNESIVMFEEQKIALLEKRLNELVELAIVVAEKVVRVSLKSSKSVIAKMILAAVEDCKNQEWVKIYVSEADAEIVENMDADLAETLAKISSDVKVVIMEGEPEGTCIVETPEKIVDAGMETQMEKIKKMAEDHDIGG